MTNWEDVLVYPDTPLVEAVKVIDKSSFRCALVVDKNGYMHGMITDGDIRRSFLKDNNMQKTARSIMTTNPISVTSNTPISQVKQLMIDYRIIQIPILDQNNVVCGLYLLDDLLENNQLENCVFIMAGGLGKRLRPLTNMRPKPMVEVNGKPILQIIIESLAQYGFYHIYIALNYKGEMIKEFFGSGSQYGVSIQYIEENQFLGTAGALSLIPFQPQQPFIVMNSDLLTKVNFRHLLDYHFDQKAMATIGVKERTYTLPYGVIKMSGTNVEKIEEKPEIKHFVNTGIYVLSEQALSFLPQNEYLDMTDLYAKFIEKGEKVTAFPIREHWLDIGMYKDLERAYSDYDLHYIER